MTRRNTSKSFSISSAESINGSLLCTKNARALLEVGKTASELGHYGAAVSLCVLAAEEGSKAIMLWVNAIDPAATSFALPQVFSRHPVKHDIARAMSAVVHFLLIFHEIKNEVQENIDAGNISEEDAGSIWAQKVTKAFESAGSSEEEMRFITWYGEANSMKNQGFYVDREDTIWCTPEAITYERYAECYANVTWWLDLVDAYCSIPPNLAKDKVDELRKPKNRS